MAFFAGARAKPSPVIRLFSVLIDKSTLDLKLVDESGAQAFQPPKTNDEIGHLKSLNSRGRSAIGSAHRSTA